MLSSFDYDYVLPEGLIAQTPAVPRDSARLFVYDTSTDTVVFDVFQNIGAYLPQALYVINDTKVVPSRIRVLRDTGKEIELHIYIEQGWVNGTCLQGNTEEHVCIGEKLTVHGFEFEVIAVSETGVIVSPLFSKESLEPLLFEHGVSPVHPYIEKGARSAETFYPECQATNGAAESFVATPTASLHFTRALMDTLTARGALFTSVTLQMGLGTFATIDDDPSAANHSHREHFEVRDETAQAIISARTAHVPVVAVGTTVVRTLESAKQEILAGTGACGAAKIDMYPPHEFTFPDALITNFHIPKSNLMCMVDAYLVHKRAERRILDLYHIAMREHFRFYSFGDAMLIV